MNDKDTPFDVYPAVMVDLIGDHFLEIARYLREVQDIAPDSFRDVVRDLNIGQRKGYALARIDRKFHSLGVPIERLRKLGWTKLAMLSGYVDEGTVEKLLDLAEAVTAHQLKLALRGEEVDPEGKIILLYLRREELALFDKAMNEFGAIHHNRGWLNKEEALLKALAKAMQTKT